MKISVGTKVVVTNIIGRKYNGKVVNVSDFREPNMKYAVDIGLEDVVFVGDKSIQPTEEGCDGDA